jgi:hypothetical protein
LSSLTDRAADVRATLGLMGDTFGLTGDARAATRAVAGRLAGGLAHGAGRKVA